MILQAIQLAIVIWEEVSKLADNNEDINGKKVLTFESTQEKDPERWVPLFYLDDEEFQILENPSPTMALKYLEIVKTRGAEAGSAFMLTELLTEDGFDALMGFENIHQDQFDAVMDRALEIVAEARKKAPKRRGGGRGQRR
jgi:hypothetical protein